MGVSVKISGDFNPRAFDQAAKTLDGLRRQAIRNSDSMAGKFMRAGDRMQKTGHGMMSVGSDMTRYVSLPLALIGVASVVTAVKFEKGMSRISALAGVNKREMVGVREEVLRAAKAYGIMPDAAADAMYFIRSSGLAGKRSIQAMNVSLKAQAAQLGDAQVIADYATSAIGAYGQENMSSRRAVDTLTQAVKVGKGEPEDYAANLGKVTGSAATLGVELDDLLGSVSAMSLKGVGIDEGTTAINQLFMNILKPSKQAREALKDVGLSVDDVRKSLDERGILPTLQKLDKAFGGNKDKLAQVFGNVRSLKAAYQLLNGDMSKTEQVFADVADNAGALNRAYKETAATDWHKIEVAKANLAAAGITIGSVLLPALADVAVTAVDVVEAFDRMSPGAKKFVVWAGVAAAALGPLVWGTGAFINGLGAISNGIGKSIIGIQRLVKWYRTLTTAAEVAAAAQGLGSGPKVIGSRGAQLAAGAGGAVPAAAGSGAAAMTAAGTTAGAAFGAAFSIAAVAGVGAAVIVLQRNLNKKAGMIKREGALVGSRRLGRGGTNDPGVQAARDALAAQRAITNKPLIQRITLKAQDATGPAFVKLMRRYQTVQDLTRKGIDLTIDPKNPEASLRSIQARLMGLGMSAEKAEKTMSVALGRKINIPAPKAHMEPAIKAAQRTVQIFRTQGAAAARRYADGINSGKGAMGKAAGDAAQAALSRMRKLQGAGSGIGRGFSDSVALGITLGGYGVAAAASSVALKAEQAMRRQLQQHSPSKKGIAIGKNFAESIGLGMEAGKVKIDKSAANLAKSIIARVKSVLAEMKARQGDILQSVGMFDRLEVANVSKTTLAGNMNANLAASQQWTANADALRASGMVPKAMLTEILSSGLAGAGEVKALASMNPGELKSWVDAWKQIQALAAGEAQVELAGKLKGKGVTSVTIKDGAVRVSVNINGHKATITADDVERATKKAVAQALKELLRELQKT